MNCNCEPNVIDFDLTGGDNKQDFNMCVGKVEINNPKPNPSKNIQFNTYEELPIPGNSQLLYVVIQEENTIYRWDPVDKKYKKCNEDIDLNLNIENGSGINAIQQKIVADTFDFYGFGTEVDPSSNDTFKIITAGCGKTLYRGEIFYYNGALFQIPLSINKITFTDDIVLPIKLCAHCGNPAEGGCAICVGEEGKEPLYYWYVGGDGESYHYIFIRNCEKEPSIPVGASGNESSSSGVSAARGSRAKSSGYHTIALGSSSSAEGLSTFAGDETNLQEGHATHAEGWKTRAEGRSAHSEGNQTYAKGSGAHAEGRMTFAMFDYCHTEGDCTVASGEDAHAEGVYSRAVGRFSHAEGDRTLACQYGTHAEGIKTVAGNEDGHYDNTISGAHAEGNGTVASGEASHAEGVLTKAQGNRGSHAEGDSTKAQGTSSHAEGKNTETNNVAAHAEGVGTKAIGVSAHSQGRDTIAEGEASHAEGIGSVAEGLGAHAEGAGTKANGSYSHAGGVSSEVTALGSFVHGKGLKKNYTHQAVVGQFNEDKWNVAFTVGNGESDTDRKNAFEVYENGKIRGGRETQDGDDNLTLITKGYFDKYKGTGGGGGTADLSNYIKNTDYATTTKAGIVKGNVTRGISIEADGTMQLQAASEYEIETKNSRYKPITPYRLDYAIIKGITANTTPLTEQEKLDACTWLGATRENEVVIRKTRQVQSMARQSALYGVNYNAVGMPSEDMFYAQTEPMSGRIPRWTSNSTLRTEAPTDEKDCTNKKYVDDAIANINISGGAKITAEAIDEALQQAYDGLQQVYTTIGPIYASVNPGDPGQNWFVLRRYGGHIILPEDDPVEYTDAASKGYVDKAVEASKGYIDQAVENISVTAEAIDEALQKTYDGITQVYTTTGPIYANDDPGDPEGNWFVRRCFGGHIMLPTDDPTDDYHAVSKNYVDKKIKENNVAAAGVTSVNNKTGDVTLDADDINAVKRTEAIGGYPSTHYMIYAEQFDEIDQVSKLVYLDADDLPGPGGDGVVVRYGNQIILAEEIWDDDMYGDYFAVHKKYVREAIDEKLGDINTLMETILGV